MKQYLELLEDILQNGEVKGTSASVMMIVAVGNLLHVVPTATSVVHHV